MSARIRTFLALVLLILTVAPTVLAETRKLVNRVCPLCNTNFDAVVIMSATQLGMRLDLRPLGAITSPTPLAVCPKCGLPLWKDLNDSYSAGELKQLRGIIEADQYRSLDAKTPPYQRLGKLYEGLNRPPEDIADAYLMASWQTEREEKLNRALLAKTLEWFQKYIESPSAKGEPRHTAEFLQGELLRRLGKFDESKRQFDRLAKTKDFQKEPFPQLYAQELA